MAKRTRTHARSDRPAGSSPKIQPRTSKRTGVVSFYGDFRQFAALGGRVEALREPGARYAVTSLSAAERLYEERFLEYERKLELACVESTVKPTARSRVPRLREMIELHLTKKGSAHSKARASTVTRDLYALRNVRRLLGDECRLDAITVERLETYVIQREAEPGRNIGSLTSSATIGNELNALSNVFRRAVALGFVEKNPVGMMLEKPKAKVQERDFLLRDEARLLLETAWRLDAEARRAAEAAGLRKRAKGAGDARRNKVARALRAEARHIEPVGRSLVSLSQQYPWTATVLATFLYTGGRLKEVLGLLVEDIDMTRKRVRIRPNQYRGLKRSHHAREVQLWPALERKLVAYIAATNRRSGLLFPATTGEMMHGFAKQLHRVASAAGLEPGRRITPHTLRHTFATMLLQTLVQAEDGSWAVRSSWDVAKKLGHRTSALVDSLYGHAVPDPIYTRTLDFGEPPVE